MNRVRDFFHALMPNTVAPPVTPEMLSAGRVWRLDRIGGWQSVCPTCQAVACQCSGVGQPRAFIPEPQPRPRIYERNDRVRIKGTAGFARGATGSVVFQEPNGERCWVERDGSGSPAYFWNYELEPLGGKKRRARKPRPDDMSPDPRRWSDKYLREKTRGGHGFLAALAEAERRWSAQGDDE